MRRTILWCALLMLAGVDAALAGVAKPKTIATPSRAPVRCPVSPLAKGDKVFSPTLQKPPTIPRAYRGIASATRSTMIVRGLAGQTICVDLYLIDGISGYYLLARDRFFGFDKTDQESNGHYVIDRRMRGDAAIIETGVGPDFTDDGTLFAANDFIGVGMDDDYGKLGIWSVGPDRTTLLAEFDEPADSSGAIAMEQWETVGWSGNRCYAIYGNRVIDYYNASLAKGDAEADKLPRYYYRVVPSGKTWQLERGRCPPPRR